MGDLLGVLYLRLSRIVHKQHELQDYSFML